MLTSKQESKKAIDEYMNRTLWECMYIYYAEMNLMLVLWTRLDALSKKAAFDKVMKGYFKVGAIHWTMDDDFWNLQKFYDGIEARLVE
jgi:hypothetical protein